MGRLACIDLPAFPLQLLLRREPQWVHRPAAVVEADKPQAQLLWVNEHARRLGVLPGMRYAAGLSLASELCAGVIAKDEITKGVRFATGELRAFSPEIEPVADEPGVFWVGAGGLDLLYPTFLAWARRIRQRLKNRQLLARVAVGFTRFGAYALARSRIGPTTQVLRSPEEERQRTHAVPLDRLALSPSVRDELAGLGVTTIADLLRLPPGGLRTRYGKEAQRLQRMARGEDEKPLTPVAPEVSLRQEIVLDDAETNIERLLFVIKRLLHPLLEQLVAQRHALLELIVELTVERHPGRIDAKTGTATNAGTDRNTGAAAWAAGSTVQSETLVERLRPAEPTVNATRLLGLVLLRLDTLALKSGVTDVALDARSAPATVEQLQMFLKNPKRDRRAARRAFACLRAEFGTRAVVRARLADGHLPEARFAWEPLTDLADLPEAEPQPVAHRNLIRRCFARALALPRRPRHESDGWQVRGRDDPPVAQVWGPYLVSGGWWNAAPAGHEAWTLESHGQQREYHYVENLEGECLWLYYDRPRRRWFLQGRVE